MCPLGQLEEVMREFREKEGSAIPLHQIIAGIVKAKEKIEFARGIWSQMGSLKELSQGSVQEFEASVGSLKRLSQGDKQEFEELKELMLSFDQKKLTKIVRDVATDLTPGYSSDLLASISYGGALSAHEDGKPCRLSDNKMTFFSPSGLTKTFENPDLLPQYRTSVVASP